MRDEPPTQDARSRRSRRAVLGLTAGTLAGVAGCIDLGSGAGDDDPSPTDTDPTATPTPTDQHTPTGTGPDDSPTPVDPEDVTVTGSSVQSSALGEHVMGEYLDLRTSEGWLVYVSLGTEGGHTPRGNSAIHPHPAGYPERGALRLSVRAGDVVQTYEESRRRNYTLVGDAASAWTAFELPAGVEPDEAAVEWPAEERRLGTLSDDALAHLGREPPSFTLESFVAGEPGTTPGPTPHQSPTPDHDDFPTTTVDYELVGRNEGGAGTFRGVLDHETPKEEFIADYSQGGTRLATAFAAGEERTLTGEYTLYHREEQATVQVRAETAGGSATSRAATDG
jgi:hypothetical protein